MRVFHRIRNSVLVILALVAGTAFGQRSLVVGTVRDAVNLDPAVAVATTDYNIFDAIYEGLVTYQRVVDGEGNVTATLDFAPALATSWESSDDGLTWTFHLREGVTFHDGTPFNADAVKYTFERAIRMGTGLTWQISEMLDIGDIEVVDDYTVAFHLDEPYAPFLDTLRLPVAYIVSPTAVEANGGITDGQRNEWMVNNAVGTGPYILESRANDDRTVLVANPNYWGEGPHLDRITVRIVPDPATLRLLVSRGEVQLVVFGLSWLDMLDLANAPGISLYVQDAFPEIRIAPFNVQEPPFDDPLVRRAVAHAIDYQAIIDGVMLGQAVRLTSAIPNGTFGHDPTLEVYQYDPERARQLLAEAGYPDGFTFELAYPSADQERFEVSTVMQANLAAVGVNAELVGYAWPALLEKWDTGNYTLSVGKWAPTADPHSRVFGLLTCGSWGASGNYGRYCNERVDELAEQAVRTVDREERAAVYAELQRVVMDDAPWLFLYQPKRGFVLADGVKGFHIPPVESIAWQYVRLD